MYKSRLAWSWCISFTVVLQLLMICTGSPSAVTLGKGHQIGFLTVPDKSIVSSDARAANFDSSRHPSSFSKGRIQVFQRLSSFFKSEKTALENLIGTILKGIWFGGAAAQSTDEEKNEICCVGRSPDQIGTKSQLMSSRRFLKGRNRFKHNQFKQKGVRKEKYYTPRKIAEEFTGSNKQQQQAYYFLGPPAPLLGNGEKQNWNQDYAEPDVHPPSSN